MMEYKIKERRAMTTMMASTMLMTPMRTIQGTTISTGTTMLRKGWVSETTVMIVTQIAYQVLLMKKNKEPYKQGYLLQLTKMMIMSIISISTKFSKTRVMTSPSV